MNLVKTARDIFDDLKIRTGDQRIEEKQFLRWMVEGLNDFVINVRPLQGYQVIASVANQQEYALPPDFLRMKRVEYNGVVLRQVDRNDIPGVTT